MPHHPFSGPMHIALIGSTSAGKTTLARAVVDACRSRGVQAWLSEDFAARHLGVSWIRGGFARRRALELASILYCLASWSRYRDFHALAFRLIREAPGSWLYKVGLVRLTLRKTGIHEILRRGMKTGQVVVSDNEATLQGAHHLFVHPGGRTDPLKLKAFAASAPMPDIVLYLRTPERVIVERMLRRGHPRLGSPSLDAVERAVHGAVEAFDRLCTAPAMGDRLLVIEGCRFLDPPALREDETPTPLKAAATLARESLGALGRVSRPATSVGHGFRLSPELAERLVAKLNEGVPYCHWKSNYSLAQGDDGDLDLLVADPTGLARTRSILAELGFKEAVVPAGPQAHGVWHYYGCDPSTGSLVHVHLFNRVLTGESFVKSHRLPLDRMLFENTETLGPVRIPTKAAELVLFVLRTFIKYGSLLDLMRLAKGKDAVSSEFRWLEDGCSVPEALALLRAHCPSLDPQLFLECLRCLHNDEPLIRRIMLARRVRRGLRAYAVRTRRGRAGAYARFAAAYVQRKLRRGRGKKVWHSGGALIAFVGPDATGKSTLTRETAQWLGSASRVETAHLGKPRSSPWTFPVNGVLSALRALRGRGRRWNPDALPRSTEPGERKIGWSSIVYALRAVALAFDRRRAVRRAWLSAARGGVVVCDRYPTAQVRAMDGPRLDLQAQGQGFLLRFYQSLARIEGRLYAALPQPDVLIRLSVSVETAKRRNRDRDKADKHTDEDLESRHQALGTWPVPMNRCWDVSTEGSIEGTLVRVKRAIWEAL